MAQFSYSENHYAPLPFPHFDKKDSVFLERRQEHAASNFPLTQPQTNTD